MPEKGDRVELVSCSDPYTKLRPGTLGTVALVDDMGTVHVDWDDGSTLGMIREAGDSFRVVTEKLVIEEVGEGHMSRYAQNHPGQFEPGGEGFDPMFDRYDQRGEDEARETQEVEEMNEVNRCAACGEPCRGHWCSESCRREEDGLSEEEAAAIEDEED